MSTPKGKEGWRFCPICGAYHRTDEAPDREVDEVARFADAMRERLAANDHKGGWQGMHPRTLLNRAMGELRELDDELFPPHQRDAENVLREAADAANYAMMVADVVGALSAGVPFNRCARCGGVMARPGRLDDRCRCEDTAPHRLHQTEP